MTDREPEDIDAGVYLTPEEEIADLERDKFRFLKPTSLPDLEIDAPEFGDSLADAVLQGFFRQVRRQKVVQSLIEVEIQELGLGSKNVRLGPYRLLEVLQDQADTQQLPYAMGIYVHESVHPDYAFLRELGVLDTPAQES